MKKSFIALNLTILSLILVSFFPIQAQICGTGNTRSSNYIQRDKLLGRDELAGGGVAERKWSGTWSIFLSLLFYI